MKRKSKNYWTFDNILKEAIKHTYRIDFIKASYQAYNKARVNGWLDMVCSHMKYKTNPKNYWSYENCKIEALKYNKLIDFEKTCQVAYKKALENKWLDSICIHMITNKKPKGYWTKEKCKEEALKYTTFKDFREYSSSAYSTAKRLKILNKICLHMNCKERKPINYWNYDLCKNEALKYNNKKDFYTNSLSAYKASVKNKWINDVCSHMKNSTISIEDCIEKAKNYTEIKNFRKDNNLMYITICKNKWNNIVFKHIKIKRQQTKRRT